MHLTQVRKQTHTLVSLGHMCCILMDSAIKKLTAGEFPRSYLQLNYLSHASQNIYIKHTHMEAHTHICTHTLRLSSRIPPLNYLKYNTPNSWRA